MCGMSRWPNILPQVHRRIGPLIQGEVPAGYKLDTGPFVGISQPGELMK